jgi:hypothetical protein
MIFGSKTGYGKFDFANMPCKEIAVRAILVRQHRTFAFRSSRRSLLRLRQITRISKAAPVGVSPTLRFPNAGSFRIKPREIESHPIHPTQQVFGSALSYFSLLPSTVTPMAVAAVRSSWSSVARPASNLRGKNAAKQTDSKDVMADPNKFLDEEDARMKKALKPICQHC